MGSVSSAGNPRRITDEGMPMSQPVWWFPGDPVRLWGLFISHSCHLYEKASSVELLLDVPHAALGTEAGARAPLSRPVWRQLRVPHGEASCCPVTVSTGRSQRGGWEVGLAWDVGSTPSVCDHGKAVGPLCLSFLFSKGRKAGVKGGFTQRCGCQLVTQGAVAAPWMGC